MWREHLQELVHEPAQQHTAAEAHPGGVHREQVRGIADLEVRVLLAVDGEIGEDADAQDQQEDGPDPAEAEGLVGTADEEQQAQAGETAITIYSSAQPGGASPASCWTGPCAP